MMKMWFSICGILVLLTSFQSYAGEENYYAHVQAIGSVTLDGNSIRDEDVSKDGVEIRTEKDGFAHINILATGSKVTVGPNSVFQLYRPKKNGDESHLLKSGAIRAKVNRRSERNFKVHSSVAVFGVRGTEFIIASNSIFKDDEIVVLNGSVEVASKSDPMDSKIVKAGEWAGIGGRYGKKVTEPMKLSNEAIDAISKQSESPSWSTYSNSSPKTSSSPRAKTGTREGSAE